MTTTPAPVPPMTFRLVATEDGELVGLVSDEDFATLSAPAAHDPYPTRDDVYHGRAVWLWGEDGDMGVTIEGHGRRALAALNARQRRFLGANWRFHEHMEPEITEVWAIVHKDCGCTPEQHAAHEATGDECYDDCKRYGLRPCQKTYDWTMDTVPTGTPGAVAITEVSW